MVKIIHTDPKTQRKHVRIRLEIFTVLVVAVLATVLFLSFANVYTGNSLNSAQSTLVTETGKVSTLNNTVSSLNSTLNSYSVKMGSFAANVSVQAQKIQKLTAELQVLQGNNSDLSANNSALKGLIAQLQANSFNDAFSIQALQSTISRLDSINSALKVNNNSYNKLLENYMPENFFSLKLPTSFNTTTPLSFINYSMLSATAYNGSYVLAVGSNGTMPIAGLYNSSSNNAGFYFKNNIIGLTLESQYKNCGFSAVASNGNEFLIAAICKPNSSTFNAQYFIYNNGNFANVTSSINTGKDFVPMAMSYNGNSYLIVGYYPFNKTWLNTSKASGLFSYSASNGLKNLTGIIPANTFSNKIFSSVTWDGSQYAILTLGNNDTVYNGAFSGANITMYDPVNSSFTTQYNLSGEVIVNYGNGGIVWDGANFLIANAVSGGFITGIFNPTFKRYIEINNTVGVPGQGLAWNGYELFIPGLGSNGISPFLYVYNNSPWKPV